MDLKLKMTQRQAYVAFFFSLVGIVACAIGMVVATDPLPMSARPLLLQILVGSTLSSAFMALPFVLASALDNATDDPRNKYRG